MTDTPTFRTEGRLALKRRHRRLMRAALHLIREADLAINGDPSKVTPDDLIALAFGRHHITVDADEATKYLNAARVTRGHPVTDPRAKALEATRRAIAQAANPGNPAA